MERRDFLKQSCMACLAFAGAGAVLSLQGCSTLAVVKVEGEKNAPITVPLASIGPDGLAIVRGRSLRNDILVVRNAEGKYHALLMRCSHQDQPLTATRTGLHCASHGSAFDLQGNVLTAPADRNLTRFATTEVDGQLTIHITRS